MLGKSCFHKFTSFNNKHSEIKSGWIQGRVVKSKVVVGGWPGVVEYLVQI